MTNSTSANTQTAIIPFHGSAIRAAKEGDQVWIAVKPICKHLAVSWQGQSEKLASDERFNCQDILMVAEDGKLREQTCLPQDQLLGWLYTINANKVKLESRDLLLAYQRETTQVINDYWTKGQATNPRHPKAYHPELPDFNDPVASARAWADVKEAEQRATKALEVAAPKAEAYDEFLNAEGSYSMACAAKLLGIGRTRLFTLLRENGVLMTGRRSGAAYHNLPYQQYSDAGFFEVKAFTLRDGRIQHTTYVTPRGLDYIRKRFMVLYPTQAPASTPSPKNIQFA